MFEENQNLKSAKGNVCVCGRHDPSYIRNRTTIGILRAIGWNIELCHDARRSILGAFSVARQMWKVSSNCRWVFVTEGAFQFMPIIRLMARIKKMGPVVFDPYISRYNTIIEDRKLHSPYSIHALILKFQDWSGLHAADALVFDTVEHGEWMQKTYGTSKPSFELPVMIDQDKINQPENRQSLSAQKENSAEKIKAPERAEDTFKVLFFGTYIPLQGADVVVRAAALLRSNHQIRFQMVGDGQTRQSVEELSNQLGCDNIDFYDFLPKDELSKFIKNADLCLGIFGQTRKAEMVIANKVVLCAASAKALISRDANCVKRVFSKDELLCVPPDDPQSLSRGILRIAHTPELQRSMETKVVKTFQKHFSQQSVSERWNAWLKTILTE